MSDMKCKRLCQQEAHITEWESANSEAYNSTRKALDKAKWWLHEIVENHRYTPISTAEMALKELEQRDKTK